MAASSVSPASPYRSEKVFIAHAGQQKRAFVSFLKTLSEVLHPELAVFVDEWSLRPGEDAMSNIQAALQAVNVVVFILSKDFVRKKYPMDEVADALVRLRNRTAADKFTVLPVLYDITYDEIQDLCRVDRGGLYTLPTWCPGEQRPPDTELELWATNLRELFTITASRSDQHQSEGEHALYIVQCYVQLLVAMGEMPAPTILPYSTAAPVLMSVGQGAMPSLNTLERHSGRIFGRDGELAKAFDLLKAERFVEVSGGPGEGKSMLAAAAAECLWASWIAQGAQCCAHLVDFKELGESADGAAVKQLICQQLKSKVGSAADSWQGWDHMLAWARQQESTRKNVLLVFDYVEQVALKQEFAEALLALHQFAVVHIILATRQQPTRLGPELARCRVELGMLGKEAALQLLMYHMQETALGQDMKELADDLLGAVNHNPLAVAIAGDLIQQQRLSLEEARNAAKQGMSNIDAPFTEGDLPTYVAAIARWLRSSLRPGEQQFLANLCVFPGSFPPAGAAAVQEPPVAAYVHKAARLLWGMRTWSLLHTYGTGEPISLRYRLHAVVREAALVHLPLSSSQAQEAARGPAAAAVAGSPAPTTVQIRFLRWMLHDSSGPGAALCQQTILEGSARSPAAFAAVARNDAVNFAKVAELLVLLGGLHADEAAHWLHRADTVAVAMADGGLIMTWRGMSKAAMSAWQALPSEVYGMDAVRAQLLYAESLRAAALFREAMEEADRAWDKFLELEPNLPAGAAVGDVPLHVLQLQASLQWQIGGLEQACVLQAQCVRMLEERFGPQHALTLQAKARLGSTLVFLGRVDEGLRLLDTPHTSGYRGPADMAAQVVAQLRLGNLADAELLAQEAVQHLEERQGPEHAATLAAKANYAVTLSYQGRAADALRVSEEISKSLEAMQRELGNELPWLHQVRLNMAVACKKLGQLDRAQGLETAAIEALERMYGPQHPSVLQARVNYVETLWHLRDHDAAWQENCQTLALCWQALPPLHPTTKKAGDNLDHQWMRRRNSESADVLEAMLGRLLQVVWEHM